MDTRKSISGIVYTKKVQSDLSPTISVQWYSAGETLVEGVYLGTTQSADKNTPSKTHNFLRFRAIGDIEIRKTDRETLKCFTKVTVKDGEEVLMWDSPDLSIKFRGVEAGTSVLVVYEGMKKGPSNKYNSFSVYVAE